MPFRFSALPILALGALGCTQAGETPAGADVTGLSAAAPQVGQAPAAVPETDPPESPLAAADESDDALPTLARSRGNYYGSELEGFSAEEFYWMNPEADRWPDDLDPRDNSYLPSPVPNVTFTLE